MTVGGAVLTGCLGTDGLRGTGSESETPTLSGSETAETGATTEPATDTEQPSDETESESPTGTPPLNETQYPVGYPWRQRTETFLSSPVCVLANRPSFVLVDSQEAWQDLTADTPALSGYPFVADTGFDTKSIVCFEVRLTRGERPTVPDVTGVSDGKIVVTVTETGTPVVNGEACVSVFVRVPVPRSDIGRVTVRFVESGEEIYTESRSY